MWKNVRGILAIITLIAYVMMTGYETFHTKEVPNNFYSVVSLIIGAYFVTRAKEGGAN